MATKTLTSVEQIRRKAERLFPRAIDAWLGGEHEFFPVRVPANMKIPPGTPHVDVVAWSARLAENSKASTGSGYTVERSTIRSRAHGTNEFPTAIFFDSLTDLAAFTRKKDQLKRLRSALETITERLPELKDWTTGNWKKIVKAHQDIPSLLTVVEFMRDNPMPGCYIRELPVAVSTKLVESYKPMLQSWLDIVLPPEHINFGADSDFAARYGFRSPRRHILVRVLDEALQRELGLPWSELSLPADQLTSLPVRDAQIIFTENKLNVLTIPRFRRGIVIGGLGNDLKLLSSIPWLKTSPVTYFGDIDVEGFQILSRFRHLFPHAQSIQMHLDTLNRYRELCIPGNGSQPSPPTGLTDHELAAFQLCVSENLRLEQERIPYPALTTAIDERER
ncbi:MAG: hypothetical protein Aurels2KO_16570 [Aureliella sp.]